MPLPYRWLTALMVRYNGSSLLIDCGEGTQIAIKEKGWSFKPIDVICFTHYHGDHISGLPGLLLTMGNADRTEPLTLVGPRGLERVVNALRVIAPELPFPIKYVEITEPEQTFEMNGYRLKAFRVNHNVLCYGYTMEVDRAGKFDVERATAAQNCDVANIDRAVEAASRQIDAIEYIDSAEGLETLSDKLQTTAHLRRTYPEITMGELAEMLGVSKSCVSHRLEKLTAYAEKLRACRGKKD